MKYYIFFSLLLFAIATKSSSQTWQWANGTRGNNNYAHLTSMDVSGNIYVSGETFTQMNFISDTLAAAPYTRVYLAKFDSAGSLLWIKGNTGSNATGRIGVLGLVTDVFGDTYLLGCYDTVIGYDGHVITNPHAPVYSGGSYLLYLFLSKFDAAGNNKWVKKVGDFPVKFWAQQKSISTDCEGNIFIGCNFATNANIGSYHFTNFDTTTENTSDMLLIKMDSSGSTIWAKRYGDDSDDYICNVAVTPTDSILVTGTFLHQRLVIGADTLLDTNATSWIGSAFISKLDNFGNPAWAKVNGDGIYVGHITDIEVTSNSEFYTTAYYRWDFSLGSYVLPYAYGMACGYLSKYDIGGNLLWAKSMMGNWVIPHEVSLDGCGNAWVMGVLSPGLMFENDTIDGNIITPPVRNDYPLFVTGWTSSGSYINTTKIGSGGRSSHISIITDRANKLFITGHNTLDTLLIASDTLYSAPSTTNMFLAKYDPATLCSPYIYRACETLEEWELDNTVADIDIFPNPASTGCTIRYNAGPEPASCTVYDITGRKINMYPLSDGTTYISTNELSAGIYIFTLEKNGARLATRKVVIMR